MAGSAQGAVDSLLGSLTSVLLDEAKLLGSVRGDIQFIKDEMESMNGFLKHVAKVAGDGEPDDQVSAWMKQVREVAYNSEECIDQWVRCLGTAPHHNGLLGCIGRIPWLLWTLPARHRTATRIRELKARAREVGERRLRYGVIVPGAPANQQAINLLTEPAPQLQDDCMELQDGDRRRRALVYAEAECFRACADEVFKWLTDESGDQDERRIRVISIVGWEGPGGDPVARHVCQHSSLEKSFYCKAWISVGEAPNLTHLLAGILAQVLPRDHLLIKKGNQFQRWSQEELADKLKEHLERTRFLIVLDGVRNESAVWSDIMSALPANSGNPNGHSAVILTTSMPEVAVRCSPYKTFSYSNDTIAKFFVERADTLSSNNPNRPDLLPVMQSIVSHCAADVFLMKLFLHVLYVKPRITRAELTNLEKDIHQRKDKAADKFLMLCYSTLPTHYQDYLFYLTSFPQGYRIRRTSLLRRWVAEGLTKGQSAMDEADGCFNALVDRGFLRPEDMGAAGKVKACEIHGSVFHFITWMARHYNTDRLPIPNGMDDIRSFLESPSASRQPAQIMVLDLEGWTNLEECHLKYICSNIFQLKYLSLRKTNVTCLPEQINKLQHLEMLDIRETMIQAFPKGVVLPMLKYLLAGHTKYCPSTDAAWPEESFSAVHIPPGLGSMGQMKALSHVQVSKDTQELKDIGQLLQLRKLGVVLHWKKCNINHLFRVIERLNKCLRSLSIRIEPTATIEESPDMNLLGPAFAHPKFLESLTISGFKLLPPWIGQLHQLIKITLHKTPLIDLHVLGKLALLRCLRLRDGTYRDFILTFAQEEFQNLKFLVVESPIIMKIKFETGATPKLEKIVWYFTTIDSFYGIEHLPNLKEVELKGDWDACRVKDAIAANPNRPLVKHSH